MAKTAKIKKRQVTVHSRAARRAASPSINLDKSLKPTTRDESPPKEKKPRVLAAQDGGIKKAKSKPLKRAQRLRQIKGMEKAEDNMDKLELKKAKSLGRDKTVRERKKEWDNVNTGKKAKKGNAFAELEEDGTDVTKRKETQWVDDEAMDVAEGDDNVAVPEVSGEVKELVVPESIPLPVATVAEDEML